MAFQRKISAISLLFIAIGGMVGSGWLFGPFYAAQAAGPAAAISWVLGGLLMMLIALTFSELAAMLPLAGGMARFMQFSHGPFASFTLAWVAWLAAVVVAPIETMAMLQYTSTYLPSLMQSTSDGSHLLSFQGILLAAVLMALMCWLNMMGARWFTKTNAIMIVWKLAVPIATIFLLFHAQFHAHNFVVKEFAPSGLKGILHALPAAGIIFSFIGYSPAIQLAGEAKNPQRAVPWAVLGAITLCIIMFVCLQLTFIGAIGADSLRHGWAALQFSNDAGPVAGLLGLLGFVVFVKILYIDAVVSPLGTAFIYTAATSRMNYAMSKNGYMPAFLQNLNARHVPAKAMWINFAVGLLFFMPFPGWQKMVSFLVSCFVLSYAVGPIALMSLRKTLPNQHRPFRLPFAPLMSFAAFYVCNLIVYWTGWETVWHLLAVVLIGYLVLWIARRGRFQGMQIQQGLWLLPYLVGLGVISYLGAFGGHNNILFGRDFFVLALFSLFIFILAYVSLDKQPVLPRSVQRVRR